MNVHIISFDGFILLIGLAGTIGGVFSFFRYGNYKATVKLQNDSIAALEKNNEILSQEIANGKLAHIQATKEIGILEGQVRIYKDLQLDKMAAAMQDISSTNAQILEALKGNLGKDVEATGGLLVHTPENASSKRKRRV